MDSFTDWTINTPIVRAVPPAELKRRFSSERPPYSVNYLIAYLGFPRMSETFLWWQDQPVKHIHKYCTKVPTTAHERTTTTCTRVKMQMCPGDKTKESSIYLYRVITTHFTWALTENKHADAQAHTALYCLQVFSLYHSFETLWEDTRRTDAFRPAGNTLLRLQQYFHCKHRCITWGFLLLSIQT